MSKILTLDDVTLEPVNVNVENARLWVEALESGKFRQTTEKLSRKDKGRWKHCCLGVACELSGVKREDTSYGTREYDYSDEELPAFVAEWLTNDAWNINPVVAVKPADDGSERAPSSLAELNDQYDWTFKEIAALIRRDWLNE